MITKLLALRLLACTQLRGAKSSPLVGVKVAVRCSKSSGERIKTNLPKKLSGERRAIFFGGDRVDEAVRWRRCLIHPNLSSTSSKWYCWASAL
jgi:hypothetical protein